MSNPKADTPGVSIKPKPTTKPTTTKPTTKPTTKMKLSDTDLAILAMQRCVSPTELILSETFPYVIVFIIFYITTSRAYYLMSEANRIPCQDNIRRGEYNDFISGFVYWIISFTIIIFIKFNDFNLINKFILSDKLNTVGVEHKIDRLWYVIGLLITVFTSVLNIYFVYILLLTLYHIINKTINLIICKSEVCSKYNLCKDKGDPSKARYYNGVSKTCHDRDFKDINEPTTSTSNSSEPTFTAGGDLNYLTDRLPDTGRLYSDFYPSWITEVIQTNLQSVGGAIMILITIGLCSFFYVVQTPYWKICIGVILLVYCIINFVIIPWIGIAATGEGGCLNITCEPLNPSGGDMSSEICEQDMLCKERGFTECHYGRCDDANGGRDKAIKAQQRG